jgi:hypothetical protein
MVVADDSGGCFHIICVPVGSFRQPDNLKPEFLFRQLHLTSLLQISTFDLPLFFCLLLSGTNSQQVLECWLGKNTGGIKLPAGLSGHLEFAEELVYGKHVPFGQPALPLESIGTLATNAINRREDLYAGFVIGGEAPLLLLTVPEGMIICGSDAGMAIALNDGLRRRVVQAVSHS